MNKMIALFLSFLFIASPSAQSADGEKKEKVSIQWSGDIRLRHDIRTSDEVINGSPHQQRLAFRLGGKTSVNDSTDVEFRFATGTGRTSVNQTMGQTSSSNSGFLNLDFRLDRAYFDWHGWSGLNFLGGRIKNTYSNPGRNDLQFDSDLNFDGWAALYRSEGTALQPFLSAHYYWINKSTASSVRDVTLQSVQAGLKGIGESLDWSVSAGFFHYDHIQGAPVIGTARGNRVSAGAYLEAFRVAQFGAETSLSLADRPLVFFADILSNLAAHADKNAYIAGVRYGDQKKVGYYQFSYDYRRIEQDALVGAFTDSNTLGANSRAHRVRVCYVPAENVCVSLLASIGVRNIADGQVAAQNNRYLADLQYSF